MNYTKVVYPTIYWNLATVLAPIMATCEIYWPGPVAVEWLVEYNPEQLTMDLSGNPKYDRDAPFSEKLMERTEYWFEWLLNKLEEDNETDVAE